MTRNLLLIGLVWIGINGCDGVKSGPIVSGTSTGSTSSSANSISTGTPAGTASHVTGNNSTIITSPTTGNTTTEATPTGNTDNTSGTTSSTAPSTTSTTSNITSTTSNIFSYFPRLNAPNHLIAVNKSGMNGGEIDMITSLEGVLAKTQPKLYMVGSSSDQMWLDDLVKNHGITTETSNDAWGLIDKFKGSLSNNGYILTDASTISLNTAFSLAGVLGAVVVDKSIEPQAIQHGLTKVLDTTGKSQKWAFDNYGSKLSKSIIIEQDPQKLALHDYGPAVNGLFYFTTDDAEKATIEASLQPDSPALGWPAEDEFTHVSQDGKAGLFTIASDFADNLSALSAISVPSLNQHTRATPLAAEDNVHYVMFVYSDGDNIQWILNGFGTDAKWYGSPDRGKVPAVWMLSASLADLAPSVVQWLYQKETVGDTFIGAVSGVGYFYPKHFPTDILAKHVQHLSDYMTRLDMQYQTVMDDGMPSQATIDTYGGAAALKGGVIFTYGGCYADGKGQIMWSANNKPFVSVRLAMWGAQGPAQIAQQLNSQAKTPGSAAGYSIVVVHVWTHTFADVEQAVAGLNSNIRVVGADDFFHQVIQHHAQ